MPLVISRRFVGKASRFPREISSHTRRSFIRANVACAQDGHGVLSYHGEMSKIRF
jgi:hypothetical protein